MIQHELLLLGLLKESPKHGYEIKKKIKEILFLFTGVDLKSIYYPLKILEKKGLVIKRKNKQGRRPEKLVYQLTSKGEIRFNELLTTSLLDFKRPQFSLDLSLYFLGYMNPGIAKRRLQGRTFVLNKLSGNINRLIDSLKNKSSLSLVNILKHNSQMVETESRFLIELIKTL